MVIEKRERERERDGDREEREREIRCFVFLDEGMFLNHDPWRDVLDGCVLDCFRAPERSDTEKHRLIHTYLSISIDRSIDR